MAAHTTSRPMISLLSLRSDHLKRLFLSLMSTNYVLLQRSDHHKWETARQSRLKIARHQSDPVSTILWGINNRRRINNPNCQTRRDLKLHLHPSSIKNIEAVLNQCYQLWLDRVTLRVKTQLVWKVQIVINNRVIDHQCLRIPSVNLLEPIKSSFQWLCLQRRQTWCQHNSRWWSDMLESTVIRSQKEVYNRWSFPLSCLQ